MPTPGGGVEGLKESFQEAENALKKLQVAGLQDEKQLNLATSFIHDLERRVMRIPSPDERDLWRAQLDTLQHQLNEASGEHDSTLTPPDEGLQEVVGDIDDLFSGMQLSDSNKAAKQEFIPQGVPGRRYMKIVRGANGDQRPAVAVASPPAMGGPARALASPLPDAGDAVGQEREDVLVESDDEHGRYRAQRIVPPSPLRVELPDMPLAAAVAAGPASHGSADSTMARRGGDAYSDSDDESITSPENLGEGGFR